MKKSKIIKSTATIIAIGMVFIGTMVGCQVPSAEKVLAEPAQRQEVMQSIASDGELAAQMIDTMLNHQESRSLMAGNERMIKLMLEDQQTMSQVMMDNPELRNNMMNTLMNNREMMSNMSMQASMGMMEEGGMMMEQDSMMHENSGNMSSGQ